MINALLIYRDWEILLRNPVGFLKRINHGWDCSEFTINVSRKDWDVIIN